MAASPRFKVYTRNGEYIASTTQPESAAMIVGGYAELGMSIRDGHSHIVWLEGYDGDAGESYDRVAEVIWERIANKSHLSISAAAGQLAKLDRDFTVSEIS